MNIFKTLFLLWDKDFSKVTLIERIRIAKSERLYKKRGIYYTEEEVWK